MTDSDYSYGYVWEQVSIVLPERGFHDIAHANSNRILSTALLVGRRTVHPKIWISQYKVELGEFQAGFSSLYPCSMISWLLFLTFPKLCRSPLSFLIASETFVSASSSQQSFSPCCCCNPFSPAFSFCLHWTALEAPLHKASAQYSLVSHRDSPNQVIKTTASLFCSFQICI